MRMLSFLIRSHIAVLIAALASASCISILEEQAPVRTGTVFAAGDPVAVISPLPDEVSNGTWWNLNASGSSDPGGMVTNFTWTIAIGGEVTYLWGEREDFKFRTLGLYKIVLTVRDNDNNSGTAFTAVYSIIDADTDGLPDWWEMEYFLSMQESGTDDHDKDGYTNLQEFASSTDPTAKDPQPGLLQDLKDNWLYLVIIAAAIIVALLLIMPRIRRKREREEKAKIEYAIEIEKALREDK